MKSAMMFFFISAMLFAQTKSVAVERKNTVAVFAGMGVHMVSAPVLLNTSMLSQP